MLSIYTYVAGGVSLLFLGYVFVQLWKLIDIIIEVKSLIGTETKNDQGKISEILAEIASNTKKGAAYFIEKMWKFAKIKQIREIVECHHITGKYSLLIKVFA